MPPPAKTRELGAIAALGRLGFSVEDSVSEIFALIAFMGLTLKTFLKVLTGKTKITERTTVTLRVSLCKPKKEG